MATVTVPTTSTLPVAGGDIIAAPLNGWITNLKTFVEGNYIDENNVDYTNSDGVMVMGQAQTITGLKTFENTSAAAGGVRTAAIFAIDPSSGTPTDGDGVELLFNADDDEGNVATIGELEVIMTDTDNGDEDSEIKLKALIAGSAAEFMVAGTPADGAGRVVFNDGSVDIDFRIETNNIANGFVVDAGLDTFAFGAAGADDKFITISPPAASHTATTDTYALHVTAGGAQTIPSGTTALVASVAIEEPNITATGTVTSAASLYVKNAPTEGGSNYSLWVDDGAVKFDSTLDVAGDLTLSAGGDGALRFSTASSVKILDNSAASLVFEEADNAYMTFVTTNSSEAIKFDKALDINAAMQIDSTITVGADDQGYDVKFFGDTASAYLLWDTSADKLLTAGGAVIDIVKDKLLIGGTAVTTTAAELNVLDAVTAGTITASLAVVVDSNKDIGSFRNITLTGELDAGSLDVSGDADIDGTLEADAITLAGTALGSLYSPIAGSGSITTTGTVTSGTWSGVIDGSCTMTVGSDDEGDIYYRDSSGFLERLGVGTDGQVLTSTGTLPNWEAASAGVSLSGSTNNTVATVTGANALAGEANLTFDGSTLAVTGAADVSGDFTAGTVNADSDTSASDNAAMGYTSAEGLILTGQGSTSDVTIKNDADETVLSVLTGTSIVRAQNSSTASYDPDSTVGTFQVHNIATDTDQQFAGISFAVGNGGSDGQARIDCIHMGTAEAADLAFSTRTASDASVYERMRIASTGKVGIGNAAPSTYIGEPVGLVIGDTSDAGASLHIATTTTGTGSVYFTDSADSSAQGRINYDHTNNYFAFFTDSTERMRITSAGLVGIAMTPGGSHKLDVTGSAGLSTGTAWTNTSDSRIKTNVQTITGALAEINKLRPISFRYTDQYLSLHDEIDGSKTYHSFIADEYETVFPNAVSVQGDLVKNTLALEGDTVEAQDAVLYAADDEDIPDDMDVGDVRTPAVAAVHMGDVISREILLTDLKQFTPHDLNMFLVAAVQELTARVETLEAA